MLIGFKSYTTNSEDNENVRTHAFQKTVQKIIEGLSRKKKKRKTKFSSLKECLPYALGDAFVDICLGVGGYSLARGDGGAAPARGERDFGEHAVKGGGVLGEDLGWGGGGGGVRVIKCYYVLFELKK